LAAIGQSYLDVGCTADDVIVGHNVALFTDECATDQSALFQILRLLLLLRIIKELIEVVSEEATKLFWNFGTLTLGLIALHMTDAGNRYNGRLQRFGDGLKCFRKIRNLLKLFLGSMSLTGFGRVGQ